MPLWLLSLLLAAPAAAWRPSCDVVSYDQVVRGCAALRNAARGPFIDACMTPAGMLQAACNSRVSAAIGELSKAKTREELESAERGLRLIRRDADRMPDLNLRSSYPFGTYGSDPRLGQFKLIDWQEPRAARARQLAEQRIAVGDAPQQAPPAPAPFILQADPVSLATVDALADAPPGDATAAQAASTDRALGGVYAEMGVNGSARRLLDRSLAAVPDDPAALGLRARVSASEGRWEEARRDARRARELDPSNADAREVEAMAATYGRGVGSAPRVSGAAFGEGRGAAEGAGVAAGGGFQASAAGGVRAAAAAAPGAQPPAGWSAHVRAAASKAALADWPGAVLAASKAILADPRGAAAWTLRAAALNRLKRHVEALKDAEEALRLDPVDARAMAERGIALFELGRNDAALAQLRAALDADPSLALAWLYLGLALEKAGRAEEAAAALRKAVALDASLSVLAEPVLSRLRGRPSPAPRGRPWGVAGLAAVAGALLLWGLKRVFRPGWVTSPELARAGAAAALAPGVVIGGHLRVEKELGRGGMGVVYRALDQALQRPVAVKDLAPAWAGDPELRERLLREARLAARLRHPNLAQIHAVVDEGGAARLVFEYVEGRTLERVLAERGRIGVPEVRALVSQVCAALEHAHGQRVIHRDLKPGNLMLATDGAVKVLDFGIAHEARGSATQTLTAAWGTPPYMAPEQETGSVSPASDLYALAVTAYEALTGGRPFYGPDMGERKRRRDFAPASKAVPGLPAGLDAFFARALDPDPRKRPAGAAAFRREFESALG